MKKKEKNPIYWILLENKELRVELDSRGNNYYAMIERFRTPDGVQAVEEFLKMHGEHPDLAIRLEFLPEVPKE